MHHAVSSVLIDIAPDYEVISERIAIRLAILRDTHSLTAGHHTAASKMQRTLLHGGFWTKRGKGKKLRFSDKMDKQLLQAMEGFQTQNH